MKKIISLIALLTSFSLSVSATTERESMLMYKASNGGSPSEVRIAYLKFLKNSDDPLVLQMLEKLIDNSGAPGDVRAAAIKVINDPCEANHLVRFSRLAENTGVPPNVRAAAIEVIMTCPEQ